MPDPWESDNEYFDDDEDYDEYFDCSGFDWSQPIPDDDEDLLQPDELEDPEEVRTFYSKASKSFSTYTPAVESSLSAQQIGEKSIRVIQAMKDEGLNLPVFLNAIFWGNQACTANAEVRHERTTFMSSGYLRTILNRWWKPPNSAQSGQATMREFVVGCTQEVLTTEMNNIATELRPGPDPLSHEKLTEFDFKKFGQYLREEGAPILWTLLMSLAWGARQAKNTTKDPFHVIMLIIVMLSYTRSHHRSRITMIWSIYLKACGLSARAFDALHALGITMSHKWTANAIGRISFNAMERMKNAVRTFPWAISHDNMNLPLRVFSQRLHNKSHFISASAATVWIFPKEAKLPDDINKRCQEQRRAGAKQMFSTTDLYHGPEAIVRVKRNRAQAVYCILRFLLESPAFASYAHKDDPLLKPPPPVELLPCGPENITGQHILQTVAVDESSYDGTDELVNKEYLNQMGYTSPENLQSIGLTWAIPWIGDQLTAERIRGLAKQRHDEPNPFLRMDWVFPTFGWFHLLMQFANSLHSQHLGTSGGIGLRKAFEVLGRKYLLKQETKGIFWHHLDEALWHVGEANFLSCWMQEGRVNDLADLVNKTPAELADMADKVYTNYASQRAHVRETRKIETERDQVFAQMALFGSDLLSYFDLREAMQIGDVGRMEDLLPTLLYRFAGGSNPKYTIEVLELLQGFKQELPIDMKQHIKHHCWLINRTGRRDDFTPVDQGQEQNIKDNKVTYRSFGPGASFGYIQKVSPAIPTLRGIKESVRQQFTTLLGRGKRHGKPSKDKDVALLVEMYQKSEVHIHKNNRTLRNAADRAKDYITIGADEILNGQTMARWWNERSFERSDENIWSEEEEEL
ncbi:hypothetical protein BXZ70DRAFT_897167 [Cristinia sonorae]|uniref:DUF6589 domain-containing protein n=1 Tax=Cristinia sonorae TaxID=1940300 RepID=A0A8K0XMP5_9AGAR|nr:hypothetical protein BXZ70DRAFT_897167 [Cristinia sonorae]